jgi:ribonuclease HII
MLRAGIDEAGRGPVIGPMVMAICGLSSETAEFFLKAGVKDSKLILSAKREQLAELIRENAEFLEVVEFSPKEIDDAVNNPNMNLNRLEAKGTAILLSKFWENSPNSKVAVDLPSNNESSYRDQIKVFAPEQHKQRIHSNLILEHKADSTYIEASCASIIAKTIRDLRVREIENKLGFGIGSGYPSDPKTITFLKSLTPIGEVFVRKSWASYKRLHPDTRQKTLK